MGQYITEATLAKASYVGNALALLQSQGLKLMARIKFLLGAIKVNTIPRIYLMIPD